MENKETQQKPSKEELLKGVAEVLEEALAEYENLTKMDMSASDNLQMAEDPARPMPPQDSQEESEEESEEEKEEKPEAKEEKKDKKKPEEKKEDEESDENLEAAFKSLTAKMESRGLLSKTDAAPVIEAPKAEVQKSETKVETPAPAEDKTEALTKSVAAQFEALSKTIATLSEKVEKIASAPAPRKGVTGYAPLKKSETGDEKPLVKAEVVGKLLDLKKSGDRRIDTALINRVETDRLSPKDIEFLKGIVA